MPWVGLQPDGVRADVKEVRRPEGRPTTPCCGSGFSPTGFVPMRRKCVGLKADPQTRFPALDAPPGESLARLSSDF